jgi:hypothetical protein
MVSLILLPGTLALAIGDAVRPDEPSLDRRAALLVDREGRGTFRVRTHMACLLAEAEPTMDPRDLPDRVRDLVTFARETGRVPVVRGVPERDLAIYAAAGLHPDPASRSGSEASPGVARHHTLRPRGWAGVWAGIVAAPRALAVATSRPGSTPSRVPLHTSRG